MVSSDTIVGIVGAVILTGAMVAVFYYENNTAEDPGTVPGEGENLYTVIWTEEDHPATEDGQKATGSDTIATGAGNAYEQAVSIPNYTSEVNLRLQWQDDQTAPGAGGEDEFRIELLDPEGNTLAEDTSDSGEITLSYTVEEDQPVAGEPGQMEVTARGDSPEDAQAAVKEEAGSFEYTVRVTLVSTNSQIPDPLGDAAGDPDNSFTFYLGYTHWHAFEQSLLPTTA